MRLVVLYSKNIVISTLLFGILSCSYTKKPHGELDLNQKIRLTEGQRKDSLVIVSYFQERFEQGRFSGTFLFADKGKVIAQGAFGYGDLRKKDSLNLESVFQLASVSKTITATAVMQLCEKGMINLEDSVQVYLPSFIYSGISIRHLLSHQSGLPEYWYFTDSLWNDWNNPITNDDVLCLMEEYCPNKYYLPGKKYNYINSNFIVLAKIVELVSGQAFDEYVRDHIFEPAGMMHSFIYNEFRHPEFKNYGVKGHEYNRRYSEISYLNGVVGDKGAYSTVGDMFLFDRALRNELILSKETQDIMYTHQHEKLHSWDNYALGWRVDYSDSTNKIVYHKGWWKGFKTMFVRELDNDKVIVVLSNHLRFRHFNMGEVRALLTDLE